MFRTMILLTLMATSGHLLAADNPFVGTWTSNFSKSKLPKDFPFKSVQLQFAVVFDTVTIGSMFVNASGKQETAADLFHTDGKEHPGTLNPGVIHQARWIDSRTLETSAKKDGKDVGVVTYEVSADGKTLTSKYSISPGQVLVYERRE